jgi:hypothetical protein
MNARLISAVCVLTLIIACGGKRTPTSPSTSPTPIPTPTRIIGVSGNLAFGNVQVGQAATATLTITNSGNASLTVAGVTVPNDIGGPYTASWKGLIPAGGSQPVSIRFAPTVADSFTGVLTVNGDQTSGIDTVSISGRGTSSGVLPFTVSSICDPFKGEEFAFCAVLVAAPGDPDRLGVHVVADLRAFGLSRAWRLERCYGCGFPYEFDAFPHVPADVPAGIVPITFTVSDAEGRTTTTTANLQVVR